MSNTIGGDLFSKFLNAGQDASSRKSSDATPLQRAENSAGLPRTDAFQNFEPPSHLQTPKSLAGLSASSNKQIFESSGRQAEGSADSQLIQEGLFAQRKSEHGSFGNFLQDYDRDGRRICGTFACAPKRSQSPKSKRKTKQESKLTKRKEKTDAKGAQHAANQ